MAAVDRRKPKTTLLRDIPDADLAALLGARHIGSVRLTRLAIVSARMKYGSGRCVTLTVVLLSKVCELA